MVRCNEGRTPIACLPCCRIFCTSYPRTCYLLNHRFLKRLVFVSANHRVQDRVCSIFPRISASPPVGTANSAPHFMHFTSVEALLNVTCSFLHFLHATRKNLLFGISIDSFITSLFHNFEFLSSPTLAPCMLLPAFYALVSQVNLLRCLLVIGVRARKTPISFHYSQISSLALS